MSYITLMNAFLDRSGGVLSAPAQAMYLRLFGIANRLGWPPWFCVTNKELLKSLRIGSEHTLRDARTELSSCGCILWRPRGRRLYYHLCTIDRAPALPSGENVSTSLKAASLPSGKISSSGGGGARSATEGVSQPQRRKSAHPPYAGSGPSAIPAPRAAFFPRPRHDMPHHAAPAADLLRQKTNLLDKEPSIPLPTSMKGAPHHGTHLPQRPPHPPCQPAAASLPRPSDPDDFAARLARRRHPWD